MQVDTIPSTAKLVLKLPPCSKHRPRVTCNGTYYAAPYQRWMAAAVNELRQQWKNQPLKQVQKIDFCFYGNHAGKDLDNIVGAVLDAMVKSDVLINDNLNVVKSISATWERSTTQQIEVTIIL